MIDPFNISRGNYLAAPRIHQLSKRWLHRQLMYRAELEVCCLRTGPPVYIWELYIRDCKDFVCFDVSESSPNFQEIADKLRALFLWKHRSV